MIKVPNESVYSLLDVWNSVSSHNDYYQFSDTSISTVNKDFKSCVLWAESGFYYLL